MDAFLAGARTCRVATVSAAGRPHISPLWFVWDGASLWLYSLTRSRRWAQLRGRPWLAAVVDAGEEYGELCGAELSGPAVFVGESPRTGEPCAELERPERLFARKYFGLDAMPYDGRHGWLRLTPDAIASWDFRKLRAR
ncbi:pyridoxamine 5'-phosphate oxidase family protein [Streptomyces katsurahamanus]|uniref:Pyridoxamine 5'-phosphate oxidase family protein n=1 Tax=Streptomyces katsurahamanus TaxID=2577098 RepID=A0ABW9NVU6_9ACTN|nr:pyridoxamine 5'-phosphate oxidase family protein [Streptomyces katsurahamanus]MQS37274.1 pyridoxamine 5'-phosphate oxidase family protein [Streptomyces katsurahamanus]